jgi:ribosome biogenesis protein BMS1
VVTGKNRRCTFIECPNDISSMIDVAKVADLVLLMVDANFGFEMEIFEFLNIAQVLFIMLNAESVHSSNCLLSFKL